MQATSLALALSFSLLALLLCSSAPLCAAKGRNNVPWWGVNWGRGLSSKELDARKSVAIIKQYGFKAVKLFFPEPVALAALEGTQGIGPVGSRNETRRRGRVVRASASAFRQYCCARRHAQM